MKVEIGKNCGFEVEAGKDNIMVRRLFAGVVVDRYNTTDLRVLPVKRVSDWMVQASKYLGQDKVLDVIEVPPIPALVPNVFERLEAAQFELFQLQIELLYLKSLLFAGQAQSAEPAVADGQGSAIAAAENSERLETTPSPAPVNLGSLSVAEDVEVDFRMRVPHPEQVLPSEY